MLDIDKGRTIRDVVLRSTDCVTWESTVFDGIEHPCWKVCGDGWRAVLSNLWDVMSARGRSTHVEDGDRFALIKRSILEVFDIEHDDAPILGFSYGETVADERLYRFDAEACDRIFRRELQLARFEIASKRPASTIAFSTGFAS